MAGTSLLALLDDIASVLADVPTLTKVAAKKTAGVLAGGQVLGAVSLLELLLKRRPAAGH